MAEIAQDRAAKATERERKFRASSVQAKEIAVRALELKVNWLLMSCWCFVGCELCWFVHKVHCVKTIVDRKSVV